LNYPNYHRANLPALVHFIDSVDTVFLDFKKAFDSVPHNELLLKLWRIGITGKLWVWFQEYLTHHQYYVYLDNATSVLLPVKSGVPQGSAL